MEKIGIKVFHLVELIVVYLIQFYVFKESYIIVRPKFYDYYSLRFELAWELLVSFMIDYYGFLTIILLLFYIKFNKPLIIMLFSFIAFLDYFNWLMVYADTSKLKIAIFLIPTLLGFSTLIILKLFFYRFKIVLFQLTPDEK